VEEDVVGRPAEAELHERAAQLGLHQRGHHRGEPHAAVLLRRQHAPEARGPGLLLQLAQLVAGEAGLVVALAAQHLLLQRPDLTVDERADPVADRQLLGAQREVHAACPPVAGASPRA
jgi:hypothetical protein